MNLEANQPRENHTRKHLSAAVISSLICVLHIKVISHLYQTVNTFHCSLTPPPPVTQSPSVAFPFSRGVCENSSIKQLFKPPAPQRVRAAHCKMYEQWHKQTVDRWRGLPEATGREFLAITTQSITEASATRRAHSNRAHIQHRDVLSPPRPSVALSLSLSLALSLSLSLPHHGV